MSRRIVGNVVSTLVALVAGVGSFGVYYQYLNRPEAPLEWAVDLGAGLTIGIIFFFIAWGHFQQPAEETP